MAQAKTDKIDHMPPIVVGLNAVIVALNAGAPHVLTVPPGSDLAVPVKGDPNNDDATLPYGPFEPDHDRTMERSLHRWVAEQTGLGLGYTEQLYTFGDRGRNAVAAQDNNPQEPHFLSVGYLALTRFAESLGSASGSWLGWYDCFPWEDWRYGRPSILDDTILPALKRWAGRSAEKKDRVRLCFGTGNIGWDEERVLERFELMYEAGLVAEAARDAGRKDEDSQAAMGRRLAFDHRRVLATAISRLRGKLKYRPVVFELMPETFTLFELQQTVEALAGRPVHKQNFRRLVEGAGLVERTGKKVVSGRGRPAEQFRFRPEAIAERPDPGVKLPTSRARR